MTFPDLPIQSYLPLREPTFFILLSLASGEQHGYAILKSVEALSRGSLRMGTGTLYEALARMLEQSLIERVDGTEAPPEPLDQRSKSRKAYRLTDLGRRVLAAETERLKRALEAASTILGSQAAR